MTYAIYKKFGNYVWGTKPVARNFKTIENARARAWHLLDNGTIGVFGNDFPRSCIITDTNGRKVGEVEMDLGGMCRWYSKGETYWMTSNGKIHQ